MGDIKVIHIATDSNHQTMKQTHQVIYEKNGVKKSWHTEVDMNENDVHVATILAEMMMKNGEL